MRKKRPQSNNNLNFCGFIFTTLSRGGGAHSLSEQGRRGKRRGEGEGGEEEEVENKRMSEGRWICLFKNQKLAVKKIRALIKTFFFFL